MTRYSFSTVRRWNWRVSPPWTSVDLAKSTTPEVTLSMRWAGNSSSPASAASFTTSVSWRSPITEMPTGLSRTRTASSSRRTRAPRMAGQPTSSIVAVPFVAGPLVPDASGGALAGSTARS
jgi:hypothetical protein